MKKIVLINFYKRKKEEKIKKYIEVLKEISEGKIEIFVLNEGEEFQKPNGIILSGSQKMVGEGEYDLNYTKYLFSFEKPILGICYGHQLISKYFGGEVKKAKREHKGFEEIILKEKSKIFNGFDEKFEMYESHFEEVKETKNFNKNFKIIAKNKEGGIEAIEHIKLKIYGCQFHPEESFDLGKRFLYNFIKEV